MSPEEEVEEEEDTQGKVNDEGFLLLPCCALLHIPATTPLKYVFSRVGKTLPTPQLLGHWATAPIAL